MEARRRSAQSTSVNPASDNDINAPVADTSIPIETTIPVTESGYSSDDIPEYAEHRYKPRERKGGSAVDKNVSPRRLSPPAAILLWVMLAAAIFLGFFFFDRFVQTSYGGYETFLRQITNGKVELNSDGARIRFSQRHFCRFQNSRRQPRSHLQHIRGWRYQCPYTANW